MDSPVIQPSPTGGETHDYYRKAGPLGFDEMRVLRLEVGLQSLVKRIEGEESQVGRPC